MQYVYLELYRHFSCLAADCPATCCAGWSILIDEPALQRFHTIEDRGLREDVLANIRQRKDRYYFKNLADGRCAMLDEDGLCRIWRQTEEQTLCLTCRKYPKLYGRVGEEYWMSMAASCPVVAEYLCSREVSWLLPGDKGCPSLDVSAMDQAYPEVLAPLHQYFPVFFEGNLPERFNVSGRNEPAQIEGFWKRFVRLYDFVGELLDIQRQTEAMPYLEGSFDYFEDLGENVTKLWEDFTNFESLCGKEITIFLKNYLPYRFFSRLLEKPEEGEQDRCRQVFGEAAVWYVIHLSRFFSCSEDFSSREKLSGGEEFSGREDFLLRKKKKTMTEELVWMYRFCVHSRQRERAFQSLLKAGYPDPEALTELFWGS